MNTYANRFKKLLTEQDQDLDTELSDSDAMASTLDKGTSVEDFDVDAPDNTAGQAPAVLTVFQQRMHKQLQKWISEMEEFKEYLNGTDTTSIQSILNNSSPETLFKKISDAETKKISRVAMELGSLIEILKGYLASAGDSKYKGQ